MIEEGADEKLQREVEEQLKYAELERMVMQLEDEAGDLQVGLQEKDFQLSTRNRPDIDKLLFSDAGSIQ